MKCETITTPIGENVLEKLKSLLNKANTSGVPIPLLRDTNGKPSYTVTFFFISFNIAILALAGKITKYLGEIEYGNVLQLYVISGSFYLGRKFTNLFDSKKEEKKD